PYGSLLLSFHVKCIKCTVVLAGATLDTQIGIDHIRFLPNSSDCPYRTIFRTLTASLTEIRINMVLTHRRTDFGTAFFVNNMFFVLLAEPFQCTDDRKRCTLAQSAKRHAANHLRKLLQLIQIFHLTFSVYNPFQNLQHPLRTFTAGNTLSAALSLRKAHKETSHFHHTG